MNGTGRDSDGPFGVHHQGNRQADDRQVRSTLLTIKQPPDKGGIESRELSELVLALATQPGEIR